jgi:hypothetical protein
MKIFEHKRCPTNLSPLGHLREEHPFYRICAKPIKKMEGTLSFVECEGYVDGLLDATECQISRKD